MTEALLAFGAVFVLALLRIPLAFAMGLVGFVGLGLVRGWAPTMANAAQVVYDTGFAYTPTLWSAWRRHPARTGRPRSWRPRWRISSRTTNVCAWTMRRGHRG